MAENRSRRDGALRRHNRRRVARGVLVGLASLVLVVAGVTLPSGAASAAGTASVTVTPPTATVAAGATTTLTLSLSCSVTGGCANATLTFPVTNYTDAAGNPANDSGSFGALSCTGWTSSVAAGQVTYTYGGGTPVGTLATGTQQCTLPYKTINYTTPNNQAFVITPTINGSNFTSAVGNSSTITVTASHNVTFTKSSFVPTVGQGGQYRYDLHFDCTTPKTIDGSIGTSAFKIVDPLPANFTYQSYQTFYNNDAGNGQVAPFPVAPTYDPVTNTLTFDDPAGTICNGNSPGAGYQGRDIYVTGTASTGGVPDTSGTTISNTATASWTYVDGTKGSTTSTADVGVVSVVPTPFSAKGAGTQSMGNGGQYPYPPTGALFPYTYPGDWNGGGVSVQYAISLYTNGGQAGADFAVKDPLPCMSNNAAPGTAANPNHTSNDPGVVCTNPAFIPTLLLASGFTPTAADAITVIHTDGSTATIPFSGTGWVIPTSPTVSEVDFPRFDEEGQNSGTIQFTLEGYAAAGVAAGSLLTNTATADAYLVGNPDPLGPQETHTASVFVAPPTSPSGAGAALFVPDIWPIYDGGSKCTETVVIGYGSNYLEVAQAPSKAIYLSYLAPAGATITAGQTQTFVFSPVTFSFFGGAPGGKSATTAPITATIVDPNYNDTGRTLLQWEIPAGTIAVPGDYNFAGTSLNVDLGPGCAGTYENDVTVGYDDPIIGCPAVAPPVNGTNGALDTTNAPDATNYCGISRNIVVAPINPGFSVDKSVQGNLDATPVTGGGVGNVSPNGGTATYNVTFTNTGETNLVDPVMYDLLPVIGDTEATTTTQRGSQFPVALTSVGTLPKNVTVLYSQATDPCRPEVLPNASNPGCVDDWSATPPASLASVTALEFSYKGTIYVAGSSAGGNSFSIPYTVSTPANIGGKTAWNTVGTTATPGLGEPDLAAAESSTTGLRAQAGLEIAKAASPTTVTAAGQTVTYTFTVTNGSAVALSGIAVQDTQTAPAGTLTSAPSCPLATLAPGASEDCTATYVVTQADMDHGKIEDSAVATGTPASGSPLVSGPATATVTATQTPLLTMTKAVSPTTVNKVGDSVTYSFAVANTGNVTVKSVHIVEDAFSGDNSMPAVDCPATTLAPGAQTTCTASYTVSQKDVDTGTVTNTAHASATDPNGAGVDSGQSSATLTVTASPALSLVKSADPVTAPTVNENLRFNFAVTNTGNVTMSNVTIAEGAFTGHTPLPQPTCPATTLAPRAQVICTVDYTVTQADVDAGSISNTATATGTAPASATIISSDPSTAAVPAPANPKLTMKKTADLTTITGAGASITYTFTTTNTGNVTLSAPGIKEGAFTGSGHLSAPDCPAATTELVPGQVLVCTATYTVVDADLTGKPLSNTATAAATAPSSDPVESDPSTVSIVENLPAKPAPPAPSVIASALAMTGAAIAWGLGDVALGVIAVGVVLLILRRRRTA